jgi:hypothetical protein
MSAFFWIFGAINLANGLWMLFAPESWYHLLPAGVPDTGPFNPHFVRDIGATFSTIGAVLLVAAPRASERRGVLLGVTLFYVLHAVLHVADVLAGRLGHDHWSIDTPGVFLPAVVLVVLCFPGPWWAKRTARP